MFQPILPFHAYQLFAICSYSSAISPAISSSLLLRATSHHLPACLKESCILDIRRIPA